MPNDNLTSGYLNERWAPVAGYEEQYLVSDHGRVYSLTSGSMLTQDVRGGYAYVQLWRYGKAKGKRVHILVATAFVPNPDNLPEVNHGNGDKLRNVWSNLEWMTQSQNAEHRCRVLGKSRGSNHGEAKLTEADVIEIKTALNRGAKHIPLANQFGVSKATISHIRCGRKWAHVEAV